MKEGRKKYQETAGTMIAAHESFKIFMTHFVSGIFTSLFSPPQNAKGVISHGSKESVKEAKVDQPNLMMFT